METLKSVQNQTYQNWECIIVDDFSTDKSLAVICETFGNDNRFIVLSNQRKKGAPGARNTGVENSKGDFFIFLDSDDLLSPDCLDNRVYKFQQNPGLDFIVFSTLEFKERVNDTNILVNVFTKENVIERFLNLDVPWLIMAPIWRRDSLLSLGLWNEDIISWQDWEFHIRALLKDYKFLYFSQVDNYVRRDVPLESIGTNSFSREHMQSYLRLFQQLKSVMTGNPVYMRRLYGLGYWVACQALERGYMDIAKAAVIFLKQTLTYRQRIYIMARLFLFHKISILHLKIPDYGTMRKIYYRQ